MAQNLPNEENIFAAGNDVRGWFEGQPMSPSPSYHCYFNDFLITGDYAAADWTITTTEAGAGDATEAISLAEPGGALVLTNDNADNDLDSLQSKNEAWILASGKPIWFESRFKVSDADQEDLFIGLAITDTTPLDATDKIGFLIVDGNIGLSCVSTKNSVTTTEDAEYSMLDDTYVTVGFHYNGSGKVKFYVNRLLVSEMTTNIPDDELLALTIHHQNGTNAAKVCTIDYLYVLQAR